MSRAKGKLADAFQLVDAAQHRDERAEVGGHRLLARHDQIRPVLD